MKGSGFLSTLFEGAKKINTKLKEGKYISSGLLMASKLGPYSNELSQASAIASQLGYGKRKKKRNY